MFGVDAVFSRLSYAFIIEHRESWHRDINNLIRLEPNRIGI